MIIKSRAQWEPTTLWELLKLDDAPVVALVGAGGKSAALEEAVAEGRDAGRTLILSVTTRLWTEQERIADRTVLLSEQDGSGAQPGEPALVHTAPGLGEVLLFVQRRSPEEKKSEGVSPERVCAIAEASPGIPVLLEADGAAGADLKVPGPGEPAIPRCAQTVVVVTGLPALGAAAAQARVHRRERLEQLAGGREHLDPELLSLLLAHPEGCFRGCPSGARRIWLINKADTPEAMARARAFAEAVMIRCNDESLPNVVAVGSLAAGTLAHRSFLSYSASVENENGSV